MKTTLYSIMVLVGALVITARGECGTTKLETRTEYTMTGTVSGRGDYDMADGSELYWKPLRFMVWTNGAMVQGINCDVGGYQTGPGGWWKDDVDKIERRDATTFYVTKRLSINSIKVFLECSAQVVRLQNDRSEDERLYLRAVEPYGIRAIGGTGGNVALFDNTVQIGLRVAGAKLEVHQQGAKAEVEYPESLTVRVNEWATVLKVNYGKVFVTGMVQGVSGTLRHKGSELSAGMGIIMMQGDRLEFRGDRYGSPTVAKGTVLLELSVV